MKKIFNKIYSGIISNRLKRNFKKETKKLKKILNYTKKYEKELNKIPFEVVEHYYQKNILKTFRPVIFPNDFEKLSKEDWEQAISKFGEDYE